jgi:LytR cell envelope-related transcriptional attenuator
MALESRPRRRVPIPGSWLVPAVFLIVGLGVGFGLGYVVRGGSDAPAGGGVATTATTPTTTSTAPAPTGTTPRPPAPTGADAQRARVRLVILNGTDISGLAGRTAARARRRGYRRVETGNGPRVPGRSELYYRPGALPAARIVARDLGTSAPRPLPDGSPLLEQAPRGTVFVLLGPPGS